MFAGFDAIEDVMPYDLACIIEEYAWCDELCRFMETGDLKYAYDHIDAIYRMNGDDYVFAEVVVKLLELPWRLDYEPEFMIFFPIFAAAIRIYTDHPSFSCPAEIVASVMSIDGWPAPVGFEHKMWYDAYWKDVSEPDDDGDEPRAYDGGFEDDRCVGAAIRYGIISVVAWELMTRERNYFRDTVRDLDKYGNAERAARMRAWL
jgi:hypothetical protein